MQGIEAAGVVVANSGLLPVTNATTVRVRDGQTLTTDGPFAETHEQADVSAPTAIPESGL